ncbi:MAG: hypothetical protein V3S69_07225 [Dehalococcoidales bacterium]
MAKEESSGLGAGVRSRFGPVDIPDGSQGVVRTAGNKNELVVEFSGNDINDDDFQKAIVPAGSLVVDAYVEISEVFDLGGGTPTINVGTDGSEGTNGVEISEAEAEALGTVDISASIGGTWATSLASDTTVSIALDGTTPTVTDAGHAKVVIGYVKM